MSLISIIEGGNPLKTGVCFEGWADAYSEAYNASHGSGSGEGGNQTWAEKGGGHTVNYPDSRGGYTRDCTGRTPAENAKRTEEAMRIARRDLTPEQFRQFEAAAKECGGEAHFTPEGTVFSRKGDGFLASANQLVAGREGDQVHTSWLYRITHRGQG